MKTSIEITLMPLNNNYKEIIKSFILSIRNEGFEILENPLKSITKDINSQSNTKKYTFCIGK